MKYWVPHNWDDSFNHEGLLFFVQRVQEMLFHFSDDIHRAPVHNTLTLIHEFNRTYSEVLSGEVKSYQLGPIFKELEHCFSNDKIIRDNLDSNFIEGILPQMRSFSEKTSHNLVNYIYNIIKPHYLTWIIAYLEKHIPFGNHKKEIEYGARCWISQIIMYGYSGEFIYNYVEDFFINNNLNSLDVLTQFFDRFDFEKRTYKVYMQISGIFSTYANMLTARLSLQFADDGNFHLIKKRSKYIICYFELEALDYYIAVLRARQKIDVFFRYFRFISNKRTNFLYMYGTILDCDTQQSHSLPIIPTGFKAIETPKNEIPSETIDSIILGVQKHREDGMDRLNRAIELHNSALQQQLPKDGFTNLWSALEVLSPKIMDSKLDAVLYSVLPILQNDYFMTVFDSIHEDLSENLTTHDFNALMNTVEAPTELKKVAAFCLLPEYSGLREDYFGRMTDLPLLRHKIFCLFELSNKKTELFSLSKKYRTRVEWHLYRLYRARNQIVHAGNTPRRIQVLGEHLHSYVDSVTYEFALKLASPYNLPTISSILVDTNLLIKYKERYFSLDGQISADDIRILLEDFFAPLSLDDTDET